MGTIYIKIPRGYMMVRVIKCDPDILFRITKKEAEFVKKLPRYQQDEFEDYQKLKYKFHCLLKTYSKISALGTYNFNDSSSPQNQ